MEKIRIVKLNGKNFNEKSLDCFVFKQNVTQCWRSVNGIYKLLPVSYTEDWGLQKRRDIAKKIVEADSCRSSAIGAVLNNSVIGFALLGNKLFGSNKQYIDLSEFYVSQPFRRQGIGKKIFETACMEARIKGAKKLYISAHSAKESIAAYKKYGCVLAVEPDISHVKKEPCDIQLEYDLSVRIYEVSEKEKYMNLLLLADEQREMIERYLRKSKMYVIDDCGVKGEITVMGLENGVLEIKNLAVESEFQNQGYGRKLIDFICKKYKSHYKILQVGTGDSPLTIPFYEKCGFEKSHIVKNFFIDNYDHPIIENGVQLIDMVYLQKRL